MVIREWLVTEWTTAIDKVAMLTFQLEHADLTEDELLAHIESYRSPWGRKDSKCVVTESIDRDVFRQAVSQPVIKHSKPTFVLHRRKT